MYDTRVAWITRQYVSLKFDVSFDDRKSLRAGAINMICTQEIRYAAFTAPFSLSVINDRMDGLAGDWQRSFLSIYAFMSLCFAFLFPHMHTDLIGIRNYDAKETKDFRNSSIK